MVLASLSLLPAAIIRLPFAFIHAGGVLSLFATADACVLACVILDVARSRRLHPTFAWGAPLIAGVFPLFLVLAQTSQWARLASWMTS